MTKNYYTQEGKLWRKGIAKKTMKIDNLESFGKMHSCDRMGIMASGAVKRIAKKLFYKVLC